MREIFRADSFIEGIIWLIIVLFWMIAQAFSRPKKGKPGTRPPKPPGQQPSRPSRESPPGSFQDEMREFLESIGAESATIEEQDKRPERERRAPTPPPPPPSRRERAPHPTAFPAPGAAQEKPSPFYAPISRARGKTPDEIASSRIRRAVRPAENIAEIPPPPPVAEPADLSFYGLDPSRPSQVHTIMDSRSMYVGLGSINITLLGMQSYYTRSSVGQWPGLKPRLESKDDVRHAMVGRIILGPPKALGKDDYDTGVGLR